jgi:hypothetical protein
MMKISINGIQLLQVTALFLGVYSFGNFGLTNYYGLKIYFEIIAIALAIISIYGLKISRAKIPLLLLFSIMILPYIVGITLSVSYTYFITGSIIWFFSVVTLSISDSAIMALIRSITFFSVLLCFFVLVAYVLYIYNIYDYSASTGSNFDSRNAFRTIYPANIADILSFVSGGGSTFNIDAPFRMRGYSTEPSASIVHYLAPVALGLLFYKSKFILLALFILAVNVFFISSFLGIIIILSSLGVFLLLLMPELIRRATMILIVTSILVMSTNTELLINAMYQFASFTNDRLDADSFTKFFQSPQIRTAAIRDSIDSVITSPFGGSYVGLTGVIFAFAAGGGLVAGLIYTWLLYKIITMIMKLFYFSNFSERCALALSVSLLLYSSLVSSYGWISVPGAIFMIVLYRIVLIETAKKVKLQTQAFY